MAGAMVPASELKRESWLDAFGRYALAPGIAPDAARQRLARLDEALYSFWGLGERVIALWSSTGSNIALLGFPHYALAEYASGVRTLIGEADAAGFIDALASAPKHAPPSSFAAASSKLGIDPVVLALPFDPVRDLGPELVDALVRRYSVSLFRDRAVVLLDIVGFSTYAPIEQATLLNSLSYSINSAYDKLARLQARIQFARSPTGDGFYIWNRVTDGPANVELYKLMLLLLADNALACSKARTRAVPQLRAAFHVGAHYEFYQPEGLSPSLSSYLVGQVTIDLARMLEHAMPGQILIGDFSLPAPTAFSANECIGAPELVRQMQQEVARLAGIRLSGESVREIRCYLTGRPLPTGEYGVTRYRLLDKHGTVRRMFNAKINIHRLDAAPIYLGIRESDVRGFELDTSGG